MVKKIPPRDEQEIMKIKQIKDPAMIIASHDFHLQFQWNFFLMITQMFNYLSVSISQNDSVYFKSKVLKQFCNDLVLFESTLNNIS